MFINVIKYLNYFVFVYFKDGLLSTKVWLNKGHEVVTTALPSSSSSHDVTDSSDMRHVEVLTHAYLGIIFGEPGWPYPEVHAQ